MPGLLDRTTILIIGSALVLAVLCIHPATNSTFPLWVIATGANFADTMFHEMGHSITGWLFGVPNIPSVFTLFGREQAGGLTMTFGHFWLLQGIVIAALLYAIYDKWAAASRWCYPLAALTLFIIIFAASGYYEMAISYMGHCGAMLMGAFFLYRSLLGLAARNLYERWLNAFLGLFILLHNMHFAYMLIYDVDFNDVYSEAMIGGFTHHDFIKIADAVRGWAVRGVAWFDTD